MKSTRIQSPVFFSLSPYYFLYSICSIISQFHPLKPYIPCKAQNNTAIDETFPDPSNHR